MVCTKMESIDFDNAKLLKQNTALHKELKKMTEEIKQLEIGVKEGIRMVNWNDIIPVRIQ